MTVLEHIRAWRKSFTMWINGLLLVIYPFADSIIAGIHDNLPDLNPYLPANIFRAVGLALVVYNIVHGAQVAARAAKASQ